MTQKEINSMTDEQRYSLICKLINADADTMVREEYDSSGYDSKEVYRDDRIAWLCDFLKEDLQSDNA